MRAVVFDAFGEPGEVLGVRDVPEPQPVAGEVRVRMLASPINPSDLMTVRGVYGDLPELPATPGFEGVGIVDSAGPGILGKLLVGKRVAVLNGETGNWREHTIVPAKQAIPIPKGLSVEQAAMFFVNPATAYVMTRNVLAVPRGAWLLQTAAGSALGRMVIRLGRHYGFRTLNVVRRAEQVGELAAIGGDAQTAADPADLPNVIREITAGEGVKYAIDPVGGATGSAAVRSLATDGRMLVYGTLSSQPLSFSPRDLMTPGAAIEGFWLGRWMRRQRLPGKLRVIRSVGKLIRERILDSEVGRSFSLDQVRDAVAEADREGRVGKTLLRIADA